MDVRGIAHRQFRAVPCNVTINGLRETHAAHYNLLSLAREAKSQIVPECYGHFSSRRNIFFVLGGEKYLPISASTVRQCKYTYGVVASIFVVDREGSLSCRSRNTAADWPNLPRER